MIRNYFADLEIQPTLDLERVKAAHRKLAKQFHPDFNAENESAAASFRRVQEAFEKLDSEEKLRNHCRQLEDQLDVVLEIEVTDSAWDEGVAVSIPVEQRLSCPSCRGRALLGAYAKAVCAKCGGRGSMQIKRGAHHWTHSCEDCGGSGRAKAARCSRCDGQGSVRQTTTMKVNLHDFDEASMQLRIPEAGHFSPDGRRRGSLVLRAKIRGF
jgi:molecular chaperone DnaJ